MAKLEVTEDQLHLIQDALDLYSRIGIMQFDRILEHPTIEKYIVDKHSEGDEGDKQMDWKDIHKERDLAKKTLDDLKYDLTNGYLLSGGNMGIFNKKVDESCRVAFDLQQVIRHEFWKQHPKRTAHTVDASVTLTTKDSNKIKVEL
jgi:thiamine pyrophosphokinase